MKSEEVTIKNKLGLHARAAAKLVSTASHFDADVRLQKGTHEVNGKSIMGVMMLAASKGTRITIIADGDDEEPAIDAVVKLVNNRFEEAE